MFVESEPNAVRSIGAVSPMRARDAEDRRRHEAGQGGRQHDARDHAAIAARPTRATPRASESGTVRRISSDARVTVGSMSTIKRGRSRDTREPATVDPHREDEQAGDDARESAHRVDDEAHRPREATLDLVQVDRGENRERYDDDRREPDLLERPDDCVVRATARRERTRPC